MSVHFPAGGSRQLHPFTSTKSWYKERIIDNHIKEPNLHFKASTKLGSFFSEPELIREMGRSEQFVSANATLYTVSTLLLFYKYIYTIKLSSSVEENALESRI